MRIRILVLSLAALVPLTLPGAAQDRRPGSPWERMKRYDLDGDGRVTRAEFTGPERAFAMLDRDGDGVVTKEEASGRGEGSRRDQRKPETHDWVFKRLDRDGSGAFDEADLEKILAAADRDGDGRLSAEEFTVFLTAKAAAPRGGKTPAVGEKAPGFRLPTSDGKAEVSLADLVARKRPVVVVFGSFT